MLLNIGCGRQFDARWKNIDLESTDPSVMQCDVTGGIPFETGHFDGVYHSHILEHLKPHLGRALMADCLRVLKPGGILRVVVPDLERIAELYLETHHRAWSGDEAGAVNYNWMKLELLDQMVREHSGGRMGRYMSSPEIRNSDFVRSRVGEEVNISRTTGKVNSPKVRTPDKSLTPETTPKVDTGSTNDTATAALIQPKLIGWRAQLGIRTRKLREKLAREFVRLTLGRRGVGALDEGLFRSRGEIHRWMYDRYSLRELCRDAGFIAFRVCRASESDIDRFTDYRLDTVGDHIRKPDSLFIECRKPKTPVEECGAAQGLQSRGGQLWQSGRFQLQR